MMMVRMDLLLVTVINVVMFAGSTKAVWISLPSTGMKCVSEEIQNHVVVLADYFVIDEQGQSVPSVTAKVTSPYGNIVHDNENTTHGQFAFTTSEIGSYYACFWSASGTAATLNLDWKIGIAAKDWDSVAKKEKIEGVELELRRLESIVQSIKENLEYMRKRDAEMREVSEKTNARVAHYSIVSIGICIGVSGFQVWNLKRFFQKKKLI
ncbi:Transmembrane emp24 domain-containing protein [Drosera capensis]